MPAPYLQPPQPLMRPSPAETIPGERGLPGGVQYSVKLDGIRCAAFALPDGPFLQSRGGHNRTRDFPTIAAAVARLPSGTVLDGELCAWNTSEQRFEFEALLRSRRAREAAGDLALSYIAFDALAAPDELRELPLHRRWELMKAALAEVGPPLEGVMATTDRTLAGEWFDVLAPLGIEGLVCRGLATRYRAGDRRAWVKVRHADTVDVRLLGITGSARRPRTALLELPDGQRALTPKLNALHAREIADALTTNPTSRPEPQGSGDVLMLPVPLAAEARLGSSRHPTIRFVRVKADQDPA